MGRADELAELVALLDAALDGRSGFAVLAGEPGIGKTRLAEELAALAGARAVPVLWGGCTAAEGAPAYWPWRRILRSWLAVVGPDRAAAALAGFGEVARLAPELPGEPVESDRFALFDAVARFLVTVAEEAGLVLVLDDVQWADADSLALLAHVTRGTVARGWSRRCVVADRRGPRRARPRAGRAGDRAVSDGTTPARSAPRSAGRPTRTSSAVAGAPGGNPFFVGELARAGTAALRVPSAVRDVVRARFRRLPEPCRALLGRRLGDVLGRDAVRVPSAVTGVGGCSTTCGPPSTTACSTTPRAASTCVSPTTSSARACSPTWPRPSRRGCTSRSLAALTPSADRPRRGRRARPPRPRRAPRGRPAAPPPAGPAARPRSRTAGSPTTRPPGCWPTRSRAGARCCSPAERLSVLLELARARGLAHDVAGAIATFTEAAELARATGDAAALACAALGLPEVSEAGWLDAVRGWCAEALRGLGEGDSPLKAKLLAQVAHTALFVADPRAIDDAGAAALAMAERLDDPPSLAIALRARQLARSGRRRQRRAARARRPPARARRAHRRPGGRAVGQAVALRRAGRRAGWTTPRPSWPRPVVAGGCAARWRAAPAAQQAVDRRGEGAVRGRGRGDRGRCLPWSRAAPRCTRAAGVSSITCLPRSPGSRVGELVREHMLEVFARDAPRFASALLSAHWLGAVTGNAPAGLHRHRQPATYPPPASFSRCSRDVELTANSARPRPRNTRRATLRLYPDLFVTGGAGAIAGLRLGTDLPRHRRGRRRAPRRRGPRAAARHRRRRPGRHASLRGPRPLRTGQGARPQARARRRRGGLGTRRLRRGHRRAAWHGALAGHAPTLAARCAAKRPGR